MHTGMLVFFPTDMGDPCQVFIQRGLHKASKGLCMQRGSFAKPLWIILVSFATWCCEATRAFTMETSLWGFITGFHYWASQKLYGLGYRTLLLELHPRALLLGLHYGALQSLHGPLVQCLLQGCTTELLGASRGFAMGPCVTSRGLAMNFAWGFTTGFTVGLHKASRAFVKPLGLCYRASQSI